jgi:hypothetical protein
MASLPPANTDIATRQDLIVLRGEMNSLENRLQAYVWKVVVGTAVGLYLATVGTIVGAVSLLLDASRGA